MSAFAEYIVTDPKGIQWQGEQLPKGASFTARATGANVARWESAKRIRFVKFKPQPR